jgi:hypothetical protein
MPIADTNIQLPKDIETTLQNFRIRGVRGMKTKALDRYLWCRIMEEAKTHTGLFLLLLLLFILTANGFLVTQRSNETQYTNLHTAQNE